MTLEHSELAKKFYGSTKWRKCRNYYYKKKFGICERCEGVGSIVHHKTHIDIENINDPNITLNHDNLELLCHDCHNKEHFIKPITREGLTFDSNGNLVQK